MKPIYYYASVHQCCQALPTKGHLHGDDTTYDEKPFWERVGCIFHRYDTLCGDEQDVGF